MKAKCPHCKTGCEQCRGGFTEVGFASGDLYTQHCRACGEDNGGRIDYARDRTQWKAPQACVWCGSAETEWLLLAKEEEWIGDDRRV